MGWTCISFDLFGDFGLNQLANSTLYRRVPPLNCMLVIVDAKPLRHLAFVNMQII